MAAARAFLALAVLLLGCWLSFFGRDWQQGPALAPLAAAAAIPAEPIREASPSATTPGTDPPVELAIAQPAAALDAPAPEPVPSPDFTPTHVVRAVALHLRERPTSASRSLGSYPRGTLLMAFGRDANWVEVRLADGAQGWMSARYVGAAPTIVATAGDR